LAGRIEDYAIIGNCETAALVGRDGCIDWLCLPRFDDAACFASLLGDEENGRWLIAPKAAAVKVSRRYRDGTLVLETMFETADGAVEVIDAMSRRHGASNLLRQVKGLRGRVEMRCDLLVRFNYGGSVPWVTCLDDERVQFIAGPDRLILQSDVPIENKDMRTQADWRVEEGEVFSFSLTWTKSYLALPEALEVGQLMESETQSWRKWSGRFAGDGEWSGTVLRSLITLKALTHYETGGIVAAATTSLPELIGGSRNWDYRYCWLRDATLTLYALMESNFIEEAKAWQQWLLRAVAGSPDQLHIMYGVAGERRLEEWTVPWLQGYEKSAPVRIGNAASGQVQLDIYGEVMDALYLARKKGLPSDHAFWDLQCALIGHLKTIWDQPDDGIWEVRGDRRQFTHSKVMAWVAVDRAIRSAEEFGLDGPLEDWRAWRQEIHAQVCKHGFDEELNSFVQSYGSKNLDASLLMIALVGFLPPEDTRVAGTVAAIEKNLLRDGFVLRYQTDPKIDGLAAGEGAFLACSFWLADNYVLLGRMDDAKKLFEKLVGLCNDVGLLAEEYDTTHQRQIGNFPQAFSHIGLINTAYNLSRFSGPATDRGEASEGSEEAPANGKLADSAPKGGPAQLSVEDRVNG
jgi:GH15 family glucan-1,4-alpha-glucosidase